MTQPIPAETGHRTVLATTLAPVPVWVGDRASDALNIWTLEDAGRSIASFGGWAEPTGADDAIAVVEAETRVRRRLATVSVAEKQARLDGFFAECAVRGVPATVVPFRPDQVVADAARRHGISVAAQSVARYRRLSTKSYLLALATRIPSVAPGLPLDPSYQRLRSDLGDRLIVKTERTASGRGVYVVESQGDLDRASARARGTLRTAWRHVDGETLNVHFLVTRDTVIVFPPSRQLTRRRPGCTKLQYGGNDFFWLGPVGPGQVARALAVVREAATALGAEGYRGIGGFDVVVGGSDAWIVDLNPRFQGSSLLLSLALARMDAPGLGEAQRIAFSEDGALPVFNRDFLAEECGQQLLVYAPGDGRWVAHRRAAPGEYALVEKGLAWRKPVEPAASVRKGRVLLLDPLPPHTAVDADAPVARLLVPSPYGPMDAARVTELERRVADVLDLRPVSRR